MAERKEVGTGKFATESEHNCLPEVLYDKELGDAPYTVEVNRKGCSALLQEIGMSDENIRKTKIRVKGKPRSKLVRLIQHTLPFRVGGSYNIIDGSMSLYTDTYWEVYRECLTLAKKLSSGEKKPKQNQFNGLLYTKRLPHYLEVAPPERGTQFAEHLLSNGLNRAVSLSLIHESKHAIDYRQKDIPMSQLWYIVETLGAFGLGEGTVLALGTLLGYYLQTGISLDDPRVTTFVANIVADRFWLGAQLGSVIGIFYLVSGGLMYSPAERSAGETEKKFGGNPRWRSLITITPKGELKERS